MEQRDTNHLLNPSNQKYEKKKVFFVCLFVLSSSFSNLQYLELKQISGIKAYVLFERHTKGRNETRVSLLLNKEFI